jgi:hypothetical protein
MTHTIETSVKAMRVPVAMREAAGEVISITDEICIGRLDDEYASLCRILVGRLARKRPSPLQRGDSRIWAAGVIYTIGQMNFLSDPAQAPHLIADELSTLIGVAKSTMISKAALIRRLLDLHLYEPDLMRWELLEQFSVFEVVAFRAA